MSNQSIDTSGLDWSKSLRIPAHHVTEEEEEYTDLNEIIEGDEIIDPEQERHA